MVVYVTPAHIILLKEQTGSALQRSRDPTPVALTASDAIRDDVSTVSSNLDENQVHTSPLISFLSNL